MAEDSALALEKGRKKKKPATCDAAALCKELFGLEVGDVKELDSYDDRNFVVTAAPNTGQQGARFVLKIHNGIDSLNLPFLQAQNTLLTHLLSRHVRVPSPQPARAHAADGWIAVVELAFVDGTRGPCALRLLSFLEDPLMCERPLQAGLCFSLGSFMARVDAALAELEVAALRRHHLWDLRNLPLLRALLPCVQDPARRALAEQVLGLFERTVLPVLPQLSHSILHNDANDHNVLVSADGARVVGLIDFGDTVYSATIFELGITVAYAILDREDIIGVARELIDGYTSMRAATAVEQGLLHTLAAARLCQSVIMSAYSYSQNPSNTYLLVTSAPGWAALGKLMAMDAAAVAHFNAAAHVAP